MFTLRLDAALSPDIAPPCVERVADAAGAA